MIRYLLFVWALIPCLLCAAQTPSLPQEMRYCSVSCVTLKLQGDNRYVVTTRKDGDPPNFQSVWTVEKFTPELVILNRHDTPNPTNPAGLNGWDLVYRGQISPEGNRLINVTINDIMEPNVWLVWGSRLNDTPDRPSSDGSVNCDADACNFY